jgi:hypothetical protein
VVPTILLYLALGDAAVETFLRNSPMRWWCAGAVGVYLVLSLSLSRLGLRWSWTRQAAASLLVLAALISVTAWLPGGLDHGINLVGQPTSTVLAAVSAAAMAFAGVLLVRLGIMPLAGKVLGALLAAYGVAAFVWAVPAGTSFPELFHGASQWTRLPFWLQGATVGGLCVVPLTILLGIVNAVTRRTGTLSRWSFDAAILGMCVAMSVAGVLRPYGASAVSASTDATAPGLPQTASSYQPAEPASSSSTLGAEQEVPTHAVGKNQTITLAVPSFRIEARLGDKQAPAGRTFLVLTTEWKNIGPAPYVVPHVPDHLFLLINGDSQAILSDATPAAAHPLALDQLTVPATGQPVSGAYVFDVPDHGVASLELLYLDSDYGAMRLPLFGHAPPLPKSVAGPVANDLVEAAVLRIQEVDAIGHTRAPAGERYVVIDLRMRGMSTGNLVRFEPVKYSVVRDAAGYNYPAREIGDLDAEFTASTQLLPDIALRGTIAFLVPTSHTTLTLAMNLPDHQPMELALPNTGTTVPSSARPLLSIEDGETLTLKVFGVSRVAAIGDHHAEAGKSYVILDVGFFSKVDQGIEFQTGQQLSLLDGDNPIVADAAALEALPHPLRENSVIPPHGQARFEVAYQVPTGANNLVIRYRGFESETKQRLPAVK